MDEKLAEMQAKFIMKDEPAPEDDASATVVPEKTFGQKFGSFMRKGVNGAKKLTVGMVAAGVAGGAGLVGAEQGACKLHGAYPDNAALDTACTKAGNARAKITEGVIYAKDAGQVKIGELRDACAGNENCARTVKFMVDAKDTTGAAIRTGGKKAIEVLNIARAEYCKKVGMPSKICMNVPIEELYQDEKAPLENQTLPKTLTGMDDEVPEELEPFTERDPSVASIATKVF